jgi:excisionase family DNA binding protein
MAEIANEPSGAPNTTVPSSHGARQRTIRHRLSRNGMSSTYLSVPETAEYLNTSVRFIRRLISERRIPFHKFGSHVRLSIEDLEQYAKSGRVEPVTAATVRRGLRVP